MIRTRFAPSPTGYLHVGGARAALFSWLYARHHQGAFVLRIEDTDRERSTKESVQAILDGMEWLGLDFDEGPFYQSQRFDRYTEVAKQLIDQGGAYRCRCSKERLHELREQQLANKQKPRYDGRCRDENFPATDEPFVVRFRTPHEGEIQFHDMIRGDIIVANEELDDLVILRADGVPTYNFTVVIDDHDMEITHVIRGDDHINNTPRQINMMQVLGWDVPQYAHTPMILGSDGKRLSKRHGAVSVMQYYDDGYLPEALLNYLVRLGWAHGDQEIFSREEMIELFSLDAVSHSPASFNNEKLDWLNQHYLKTLDPSTISHSLQHFLKLLDVSLDDGPELSDVVGIQAERCKTVKEMAERSRFFYETLQAEDYDEKAVNKHLRKTDISEILKDIHGRFEQLEQWQKEPLHQVIIDVAETHDLKLGKVAQPIRVAVTGGTISPPIDITLELIGRERTLTRLALVLDTFQADT